MNKLRHYRPTFWQAVFALLMIAGAYATYVRFADGLGAATNLSDRFPWGIWIGFDVLCGVGLAAGGFTLVAVVHIFDIENYKPILRPTILTAFLGYVLVCCALLFDLGRPWNIWHPMVMWNPHSAMFEVAWCVMLYTTVLGLEFAPVVCEKFCWRTGRKVLGAISLPLVILGVVLSTLHQSSLGTLFLAMPSKMYPLWYTPTLPALFFLSAICVGLAMTMFESWHSSRAFHRDLHLPLMSSMARVLAICVGGYLMLRFIDLRHRGVLDLLFVSRAETYLFWMEIGLFFIGMMLFFQKRVRRSAGWMYVAALFVIFGFLANRLNVSVTALVATSGTNYVPKWTEIVITLSIVAVGFAVFRLAAQYLPVFEAHQEEPEIVAVSNEVLEFAQK
jgi:Ni/Fe-hydrogenase subunit HybB-like protein